MVEDRHPAVVRIIAVSEEIAELEGRPGDGPYLYTSRPGDGQTRVVFRGQVCHGYAEALVYVAGLRERAGG